MALNVLNPRALSSARVSKRQLWKTQAGNGYACHNNPNNNNKQRVVAAVEGGFAVKEVEQDETRSLKWRKGERRIEFHFPRSS